MVSVNVHPIYRRIIIKMSGESLQGAKFFGIDVTMLDRIIIEIKELLKIGIQIGIVTGGGNFFRGVDLVNAGINRVVGDHIGMLATIMNGLAVCNALNNAYVCSYVMSAIPLNGICDHYNWDKAIDLLSNNKVVIFAAGTGNPLFTTDSAACLRGIELKADIVLKATKVDGVFSTDPARHSDATFYTQLSYQDVLERKLKVMDLTAFTLARDHNLPIRIFNINKLGVLKRIVMGCQEGTLITG